MLLLWLWTTTGLLFGLDLDLDLDLSILMLSSLFCVVSYFLIESKESTPLNPDLPILVLTGTLQLRTLLTTVLMFRFLTSTRWTSAHQWSTIHCTGMQQAVFPV
mmetsp:Transcript_45877/g.51319  ORF Transcript_45877/g.51319 Transcript_45877/m.51319 type:complete len:104 (+) Transcript_45877:78-389(+)